MLKSLFKSVYLYTAESQKNQFSGQVTVFDNGTKLMQISSDHLTAAWGEDGRLQSLLSGDGASPPGAAYSFDLVVDGALFFGDAARSPVAMDADGLAARVVFEERGLRITHRATLDGEHALLRQSVEMEVLEGPPRRLSGVFWRVSNLLVGEAGECFLQAPAQVTPPDFPYAQAARWPLDRSHSEPIPSYPQGWLQSAPDETAGLVAVENRALRQVVSVWQHSEAATTFPTLDGDGETISVEHRHQIAAWLRPGERVVSDGHAILFSHGSFEEHLALFRKLAYAQTSQHGGAPPQWFHEARLLQIVPQTGASWTPHLDGAPIALWTERLDHIQQLGFNLIYLLPVWQCHEGMGYALTDHFQINPAVGTAAQLKTFVSQAHARGMKVLFDFIPQGIGDGAEAFIAAHPDWLVRDELGRPFGSHGWGPKPGQPPCGHTYSLDWGRADVRRFMVEWALWNVREFDCDGFRTDALHWKEPNFAPDNPHPAWQTTFGGIKLGEELHAALHREKPGAVLLSEVWGPIFERSHHATYENGWLLAKVNRAWLEGKPFFSARQWMRWKELSALARPDGAWRANFSINHDSAHLVPLVRRSEFADALSFAHVFSPGLPFVFWPELQGREAFFERLMSEQARLSGFDGRFLSDAAEDEGVFLTLWTKSGAAALLAVSNLAPDAVTTVAVTTIMAGTEGASLRWSGAGTTLEKGVLHLPSGGFALLELKGNSK